MEKEMIEYYERRITELQELCAERKEITEECLKLIAEMKKSNEIEEYTNLLDEIDSQNEDEFVNFFYFKKLISAHIKIFGKLLQKNNLKI